MRDQGKDRFKAVMACSTACREARAELFKTIALFQAALEMNPDNDELRGHLEMLRSIWSKLDGVLDDVRDIVKDYTAPESAPAPVHDVKYVAQEEQTHGGVAVSNSSNSEPSA